MATDLVVPEVTIPGSLPNVQTVVSLAARWAKSIDQDCRPFVAQCRKLLDVRAWEIFFTEGEKSWDRLCDEVLKLKPGFVAKIVEGVDILEGKKYEGPMPKNKVLEASTTYRGERTDLPIIGKLSQQERAKRNGISDESQRRLDRLARDRPDLLEKVQLGQLRIGTAAKDAGIVKDKTPLQHVQTGWKHATLDDKRLIVTWIQDRLRDDQELLEHLG